MKHNLVAICRINGMPAQQAFDRLNDLLKDRYRDWYLALADLPPWGEKIDAQVQKYIQGVQNVVLSNLNWRSVPSLTHAEICLHHPPAFFFPPTNQKNAREAYVRHSFSFKSERYFGKSHDAVRKSQRITVMSEPVRKVVKGQHRGILWLRKVLRVSSYGTVGNAETGCWDHSLINTRA